MTSLLFFAFITGLVGSLHCLVMCGPLAFALPLGKLPKTEAHLYRLLYNLGRITTYGVLGATVGLLGHTIKISGFSQGLSIALGILILASLIFKKLNSSLFWFQGKIKQAFKKYLHQKNWYSFVILGVLNGMLPCGLLYTSLAAVTASSNAFFAAIYMIFFGLGTLPIIQSVGILSKFAKKIAYINSQRVLLTLTVFIGIILIIRGLNLGIPYLSPMLNISSEVNTIPICHP